MKFGGWIWFVQRTERLDFVTDLDLDLHPESIVSTS